MASPNAVLDILEDLESMIPNWVIDDRKVRIWSEDLADVPDALLAAAFQHYRKTLTSAFSPKPMAGDIRKIALEMVVPDWQLAWQEVLREAQGAHVTTDCTFAPERHWMNPLIPEVLSQVGGLRELAEADAKDRSFFCSRFEKAYNRIIERKQQQQAMRDNGVNLSVMQGGGKVIQISEARTRMIEAPKNQHSLPEIDRDVVGSELEKLKVLRRQQRGY